MTDDRRMRRWTRDEAGTVREVGATPPAPAPDEMFLAADDAAVVISINGRAVKAGPLPLLATAARLMDDVLLSFSYQELPAGDDDDAPPEPTERVYARLRVEFLHTP